MLFVKARMKNEPAKHDAGSLLSTLLYSQSFAKEVCKLRHSFIYIFWHIVRLDVRSSGG